MTKVLHNNFPNNIDKEHNVELFGRFCRYILKVLGLKSE